MFSIFESINFAKMRWINKFAKKTKCLTTQKKKISLDNDDY